MATLPLEAPASPDELLDAVERLATAELDGFVSRVLALQARRKAPSLPPEEAALLVQINRGLPADLRARLAHLDEKRENEELTPDEHAELLRLVSEVEDISAQRVENLSRLARLRGVTLATLMRDLGIRPPDHG